jgi:hypothetical protein
MAAPSQASGSTVNRPVNSTVLRERLGASLAEPVASLGWQPHAVRAAISRLHQRDLRIACEHACDGFRRYRLLEPAGGDEAEGERM